MATRPEDLSANELAQLGERLRALREERGLSQEGLARMTPLTRNTIWRYEAGLVRPGLESAIHLALALGVALSEIDPSYATLVAGVADRPGPATPSPTKPGSKQPKKATPKKPSIGWSDQQASDLPERVASAA